MSTTTPDPNAPLQPATAVEITLLSGGKATGPVEKWRYEATAADGIERVYWVDIDGTTFKRPASEVRALPSDGS